MLEIMRELKLRRIDVLKGLAICVAAVPVVYIILLAMIFILSGLKYAVMAWRG